MTKIHLHIEHLSLPGYSPAERRAFIAALERELTASVTGNATPPSGARQQTVRVSTPDLQPQNVARTTVCGLKLGGKTSGGRP